MRSFNSYDECYKWMQGRPEHEWHVWSARRDGSFQYQAAKALLLESDRMFQRDLAEQNLEERTKSEPHEHTLWEFWRRGTWQERVGLFLIFAGIFTAGYQAASNSFFQVLYDLLGRLKL